MSKNTHKRGKRSGSHKTRSNGLQKTAKVVKNIGSKSVSGVKNGLGTTISFLKSGFGLAYDVAKQGINQGVNFIKNKTRKNKKHSRKH